MPDAALNARQMTMLRQAVRGSYTTTDIANATVLSTLGYVTMRLAHSGGRHLTPTERGRRLATSWQGTLHPTGGDAA